MENALTASERKELDRYERIIEKGIRSFVEVGRALLGIRESGLYRIGHATFEDYCRSRWDMSRPRAYQLMEAAEVSSNLSTIVDILPANESQARPLTAIPMEQQGEVWQQAVESAPKAEDGTPIITAKHVEEVVKNWSDGEPEQSEDDPFPEPDDDVEPEADRFGNAWTDNALADIQEAVAISQDVNDLNRIAREWKRRHEGGYGITRNLEIAALTKEVGFLKQRLKRLEPFCVCPMCDGDGCKLCRQNGWLTEEGYALVPEEKKYSE